MVLYFEKFHKNSDNQYEVSFPDLEPYVATYGSRSGKDTSYWLSEFLWNFSKYKTII